MRGENYFKIDTLNSLYISRSPLPTDVFSCSIQHRTTAVYPDVISLFCIATVPLLRRLVTTCHRGGSSAIPGRAIWACSGQNDNGTGFSPNTPVLLVIIPSTFHTHVSFTYHWGYVMLATGSVFKLKKKTSCSAVHTPVQVAWNKFVASKRSAEAVYLVIHFLAPPTPIYCSLQTMRVHTTDLRV